MCSHESYPKKRKASVGVASAKPQQLDQNQKLKSNQRAHGSEVENKL